MYFIFSTKQTCIVLSQAGALRRECRASSLVLVPSLPLTPRRHRQADDQLSSLYPPSTSFSSFGAACVKLCCLPRQKHPYLLSRLSECRRYKDRFALNMKIKSAIIFLRTTVTFTV